MNLNSSTMVMQQPTSTTILDKWTEVPYFIKNLHVTAKPDTSNQTKIFAPNFSSVLNSLKDKNKIKKDWEITLTTNKQISNDDFQKFKKINLKKIYKSSIEIKDLFFYLFIKIDLQFKGQLYEYYTKEHKSREIKELICGVKLNNKELKKLVFAEYTYEIFRQIQWYITNDEIDYLFYFASFNLDDTIASYEYLHKLLCDSGYQLKETQLLSIVRALESKLFWNGDLTNPTNIIEWVFEFINKYLSLFLKLDSSTTEDYQQIFKLFELIIENYQNVTILNNLVGPIISNILNIQNQLQQLNGNEKEMGMKSLELKSSLSFLLFKRKLTSYMTGLPFLSLHFQLDPHKFLEYYDEFLKVAPECKYSFNSTITQFLKIDPQIMFNLLPYRNRIDLNWESFIRNNLTFQEKLKIFSNFDNSYQDVKSMIIAYSSIEEYAMIALYSKLTNDGLTGLNSFSTNYNFSFLISTLSVIEKEYLQDITSKQSPPHSTPLQFSKKVYGNYFYLVNQVVDYFLKQNPSLDKMISCITFSTTIPTIPDDITEPTPPDDTLPNLVISFHALRKLIDINNPWCLTKVSDSSSSSLNSSSSSSSTGLVLNSGISKLGTFYTSKSGYWNEVKSFYDIQIQRVSTLLLSVYRDMKLDFEKRDSNYFMALTNILLELQNKYHCIVKEPTLNNNNGSSNGKIIKIKEFNQFIKKFNENELEFNGLLQFKEYLERWYSFNFSSHVIKNWKTSKRLKLLKNIIFTSTSMNGHYVREPETVKFLSHFAIIHKTSFFNAIYGYYSKLNGGNGQSSSCNLDEISNNTRTFMKRLIESDSSIQLNDIFKKITEISDINYSKEIQPIFQYFRPGEEYQKSLELDIQSFIDNATFIFGVRAQLPSIEKFISNLHFINIIDFQSEKEKCQSIINGVFEKLTTIAEANTSLSKLKQLISISFIQLSFFNLNLKDLMEWFASFIDNNSFNVQSEVASNNYSDSYSAQIMNFTLFCRTQLLDFIEYNMNANKSGVPMDIKFSDFFKLINQVIPVENYYSSYNTFISAINNLPNVKVLFKSGNFTEQGTLQNAELVLTPTSCFKSSCSVTSSSSSWCIVSETNFMLSQDTLENSFRGIDIFSKLDSNKDTFDQFRRIFKLFQKIHSLHNELVRICHPDFMTLPCISIECVVGKLKEEKVRLLSFIDNWKQFILNLPKNLLLLRAPGVSSLYQKLKGLFKQYENSNQPKPPSSQLTKELYPSIKYCFNENSQLITPDALLEQIELIHFNGGIDSFLNELIKNIKNNLLFIDEDDNDEREEVTGNGGNAINSFELVNIERSIDLFNSLMELNNNLLPHPNQIFYANSFDVDFPFFKSLVEKFIDSTFFLIGTPSKKEDLINWMSDHFSNNTIYKLAKVYIVSIGDDTYTKDVFSFLSTYSGSAIVNSVNSKNSWESFKGAWSKCKIQNGIQSLNLVTGGSGTGKTHFIKNQIRAKGGNDNNEHTVLIRPGFQVDPLIKKIKQLFTPGGKDIYIHFNISCYADFQEFSQFIYPLISFGYIFGKKDGELCSIPNGYLITIYVELGDQLVNINNNGSTNNTNENYNDYVIKSIPLIYYLSEHLNKEYLQAKWISGESEWRAFAFSSDSCSFYQKTTIEMGKGIELVQYFNYLRQFFRENGYPLSEIDYLLDSTKYPFRKNFFQMLNERLLFLESYYEFYLMICDFDYQNSNSKFQDGLLSYQELYQVFLLESIQLANPKFSNAKSIWDKPPLITNRSVIKLTTSRTPSMGDSRFQSRSVDFIDFSQGCNNGGKSSNIIIDKMLEKIKKLPSYITLKFAKENPLFFNTKIASSFGITSRTNIVSDLAKQYGFVLTPELSWRLLILNNRIQHHRSMILTGDTGVGKTMLLIFYSLLINAGLNAIPDIIFEIKDIVVKFASQLEGFTLSQELLNLGEEFTIDKILQASKEIFNFRPKQHNEPPPTTSSSSTTTEKEQTTTPSSTKVPSSIIGLENTLKHQTLFVKLIEDKIIAIVENYQLIDIDGTGEISKLIKKKKTTLIKELKLSVLLQQIKEICTVPFKQLFHRIIMNKKISSTEFKKIIQSIILESKGLKEIDVNLKMVVFIDEFNTSSEDSLALINEIFVDGSFDGENCLPENIFWIGAMNPLTLTEGPEAINYTGQSESDGSNNNNNNNNNTTNNNYEFVVQQTPPSLKQLEFDYGTLSIGNESSFCNSLISLKENEIIPQWLLVKDNTSNTTTTTNTITSAIIQTQISEMIIIGQDYLRRENQARTHVSFRDIIRAIDLYQFLSNEIGGAILKSFDADIHQLPQSRHWLSLIVSVSMTYIFRLNPDNRVSSINAFNNYLSSNDEIKKHLIKYSSEGDGSTTNISIVDIFKSIVGSVSKVTKIPNGIATTESLKLNLFFTLISIYSCIPLCIVGPPGCSKTLSFSIVNDNLNMTQKDQYSLYSFLKSTQPFRYQCNNHTSDTEIKEILDKAIRRGEIIKDRVRMIVHLDEAGLVDETTSSPMKIMHDYLDKGTRSKTQIAIIILSNKILDAAKTNRMLLLVHPKEISMQDERSLVIGCLFANKSELSMEEEKICTGLCNAFCDINRHDSSSLENIDKVENTQLPLPTSTVNPKLNRKIFHQRDFVFFLRHLRKSYEIEKTITPQSLLNSLERNFIGTKVFSHHLMSFFIHLGFGDHIGMLKQDNTITRIKESLSEKLDIDCDINSQGYRYMMLLDPTENETSLLILKEIGIDHTVIRVGDFENDQTTDSLSHTVSEIKIKMSQGGTVVLVNSQSIQACFYDVFNRYFTVFQTKDEKSFLAHLSFGVNSMFCPVHPDFKVIVHLPLSRLNNTQYPWLNRFEKYILSLDQLLSWSLNENGKNSKKFYKNLLISAQDFVDEIHIGKTNSSLLFGYSKSTIQSLVYQSLKDPSNFGPYTCSIFDASEPVECFPSLLLNWKLLQIARPESLYKCIKSLPKSYVEEYLSKQEHFNVYLFLKSLVEKFFSNGNSSGSIKSSNDCNNNNNNKHIGVNPKWMIFTRTSFSLHSIRDSDKNENKIDKFLNLLESNIKINTGSNDNGNGSNGSGNLFKVLQLHTFKSKVTCLKEIQDFCESSSQMVCLIIADMLVVTNNQINFVHEVFDQQQQTNTNSRRKLLTFICHFPPEFSISSQNNINSIFLNNTEYIYIDSLGIKIDNSLISDSGNEKNKLLSSSGSGTGIGTGTGSGSNGSSSGIINSSTLMINSSEMKFDIRGWIGKVYGIKVEKPLNDVTFLESMFFNYLYQISSNMTNSSLIGYIKQPQPIETQFYSNANKRVEFIKLIFENNYCWVSRIIKQFLKTWDGTNLITNIVASVSSDIASTKSTQSFFESITSSIKSFFYPVISQILKNLINHYSFLSIYNVKPGTPEQRMVKKYIASINSLKISESIEERFEPIRILPPLIRYVPSELLLYDSISIVVSQLFDNVLSNIKMVNYILLAKEFKSLVSQHPILPLLNYIADQPTLLERFQSDYITRTLKFEPSISKFFFHLIRFFKLKHLSTESNHPILDLWVASHFESRVLFYLKNILLPIINLQDVDLVSDLMNLNFDRSIVKSLADYKKLIVDFSFKTLYNRIMYLFDHLKLNPHSYNQDIFINWITVVREVLNISSNISNVFNDLKSISNDSFLNSVHVFIIYSILLDSCMVNGISSNGNGDQAQQLVTDENNSKLLLKSAVELLSSFEFKFENVVCFKDVYDQLIKYKSIKESKLSGNPIFNSILQINSILDILDPISSLSRENFSQFLSIIKYNSNDSGILITIGWVCSIITGYLSYNNSENNMDNYTFLRDQVNKLYNNSNNNISIAFGVTGVVVNEEALFYYPPLVIEPTKASFKFLGINEKSYQHKSNLLQDSIYYVELKRMEKEELNSSIVVLENELTLKDKTYSKIMIESINTHIIEQFASTLNNNNIAQTKEMLENNHLFKKVIQTILIVPENSNAKYFKLKNIHSMSFINHLDESILDQLLRDEQFLTMIGLNNLLMDIDKSVATTTGGHNNSNEIDYNQMRFVYDSKDNYGQIFKSIETLAFSSKKPDWMVFKNTLTSPELHGLFRASLFIIIYQFYLDECDMSPFIHLFESVEQQDVYKYFELQNFQEHYKTIIYGETRLNPKIRVHKLLIRQENKPKEDSTAAQITVNSIAISLGSSSNTFLYNLTRAIQTVAGQYFPACDVGNIFRDCAMIYLDGADDNTVTMGYNTLFKYIVSCASWSAFTWTVSVSPRICDFLLKPQIHFVSKLDESQRSHVPLTNYLWDRALTSISEIIRNPDIISQHIETGQLISEFLYDIWKQGYTINNSQLGQYLKSQFTSIPQVTAYEKYLCTVINKLIKDYPRRKTILKEIFDHKSVLTSKNKDVKSMIASIRSDFIRSYDRPYFTFEKINNLITSSSSGNGGSSNNGGYSILKFMSNQIQKICLSKYFSALIHFIKVFYSFFKFRLEESQFNFNFDQCIKMLLDKQYETIASIEPLEFAWQRFTIAWGNVIKEMNVIEGGCAQRPDYEKVAFLIDNTTPISSIFFDGDSNGNGVILNLINGWVSHTQSPCLNMRNDVLMTPTFRSITEGFIPKGVVYDISDLPSNENHMLLGSDFEPNDYHQFIYRLFSQYQSFERSTMNPNLNSIQNRVINRFFAGKGIASILENYSKRFPFSKNNTTVTHSALINASTYSEEDLVKKKLTIFTDDDLQSLSNLVIGNLFNLIQKLSIEYFKDIEHQNLKFQFEMSLTCLLNNLDDFSQFLIGLISSLNYITINQSFDHSSNSSSSSMSSLSLSPSNSSPTSSVETDIIDLNQSLFDYNQSISRFIPNQVSKNIKLNQLGSICIILISFAIKEKKLYKNVCPEPKITDQIFISHFYKFKNDIIEKSEKQANNVVFLRNLCDYIKEVHSKLVSNEVLKEISVTTTENTNLYTIICKHVPESFDKQVISKTSFCLSNTPTNYYRNLMKTIHEIFFHINSLLQDKKTTEYTEKFKNHFNTINSTEELQSIQSNGLDDSGNDQLYTFPFVKDIDSSSIGSVILKVIDQQEQPQEEKQVNVDHYDEEDVNDVVQDAEIQNLTIKSTSKRIDSMGRFRHYIYYWIRYLPQFIQLLNIKPQPSSSKEKDDIRIYRLFKSFKIDSFKQGNNNGDGGQVGGIDQQSEEDSLNVDELDSLLFGNVSDSTITMGNSVNQLLNRFIKIDSKIKDLFGWKFACDKCNVHDSSIILNLQFNLNQQLQPQQPISVKSLLKSFDFTSVKVCDHNNSSLVNLIQAPEYILIEIVRLKDETTGKIQNYCVDLDSSTTRNIDISKLFNNQSIGGIYNIQSVLCHDTIKDGDYNFITKNSNDQYYYLNNNKITPTNSELIFRKMVDSMKHNCTFIVLKRNSFDDNLDDGDDNDDDNQQSSPISSSSSNTHQSEADDQETETDDQVTELNLVTDDEDDESIEDDEKEQPKPVYKDPIQTVPQQPTQAQAPQQPIQVPLQPTQAEPQEQPIQVSQQPIQVPQQPIQALPQEPQQPIQAAAPQEPIDYSILYDRIKFNEFLSNGFTKFSVELKKSIIESGIDCYSVVLNLKKEDWSSFKFLPLPKRNELINSVRLQTEFIDEKKEYQFSKPLDFNDESMYHQFLSHIINNETIIQQLIDDGFDSFMNLIPSDDSSDELFDYLSNQVSGLKTATIFNLFNQLREIKIKKNK